MAVLLFFDQINTAIVSTMWDKKNIYFVCTYLQTLKEDQVLKHQISD